MSFIFRKLSFRRRPNKGRRKSWQPGDENLLSSPLIEGDGVRPASSVQPRQGPSGTSTELVSNANSNDNDVSNVEAPSAHHSSTIDVYEDRIDDLGDLMQEQGRCLDELANRSRRLSTENGMLRERLKTDMIAKSKAPNRSPLKNTINNHQREDEHANLAQKTREENALLIQQADLLANELTDANVLIAERDTSIASLGKELSSCLGKARLCK